MGDDSITQNSEEELEGTYCSQVMLLTMIAIRGIWLCHLKCKLFKNKENLKIKCLPVTCQILNSYIHLVVGALGRVENICIVAENYIRQCCLQRKAQGDIYLGVSFQSQGKPLLSHIIAFIHLFSPSIFPTFHWIYLAENQGRFCGKQYFRKVSKISTTGVCIQCNHPTLECWCCAVFSLSVLSDSLQPPGLQPTRLLCSWGFSRQEYWSGLPCLLPRIIPTQGSNPGLPHCRQILHQLNQQGTQEYWSGSLFLLQVIFLTKKPNRGLLHCRQNLYQLSYQGGPYLIRWTPLKEGLEIRERSQRLKATETDIFLLALM